jgi:uncharacterized protein YgbK (DUF1537 family)
MTSTAGCRSPEVRTAVLDDDPTGSQAVHGVAVVLPSEPDFAEVLSDSDACCFVLTNTRSMAEPDAVALTRDVATRLFRLEHASGLPVELVSRGDSTLRGHVLAEVRAIDDARREVLGSGFDGMLLVPAYLEVGRFTADDIHFATVAGRPIPVGETEFARDASFGFRSSDLRDFLVEKSAGTSEGAIPRDRVLSIGLDDIRVGGVERVAGILRDARELRPIVVNATRYDELEVVVRALRLVEGEGQRFLARSGPSFVRALIGSGESPPLTTADLRTEDGEGDRHGLVVVGSHVGQTGRQLARLAERFPLTHVELEVLELLADAPGAYVAELADRVRSALDREDVVLTTSRVLVRDADPAVSLRISATVSAAVAAIVRTALAAHPAWVLTKGGITSHDVAVHGLGLLRATVLGQFLPGMVSALRIDRASEEAATGIRYVVFAGNVGDDEALADVVATLRGDG